MTIPAEKLDLLGNVAAVLAAVPKLEAVALGGSHARGTETPTSDLDIGLYYRESKPFEIDAIRAIAHRFSESGEPTVTGFYDWGPFVNGGAWIDNRICKIDFLYRNLDQLERSIDHARRGEWEHNFDQQPPFGFRSVTTLGEIRICRPLHDPAGTLAALKNAVAIFPSALKKRIVEDMLWSAEFSFRFAEGFAVSGDVPNTVACMTRIFHTLVQALFALNETYFVNDKRVEAELEAFALQPNRFYARVSAILAAPGRSQSELEASLAVLRILFKETVTLADGTYKSRFAVP